MASSLHFQMLYLETPTSIRATENAAWFGRKAKHMSA